MLFTAGIAAMALAATIVAAAGDVILAPPVGTKSAEAQTVGLIYAGGEGLDAGQYTSLVQAMQVEAASHDIKLWVGVPDFPLNTPPIGFASSVDRVYASLGDAGMPAGTPMIAAAHSLGGIFLQMYKTKTLTQVPGRQPMAENEKSHHERMFMAAAGNVDFKAFIFMGTFVTRSNTATWTKPTMHIAGELDGLARITRMAQTVVTQFEAHGGFKGDAVRNWPVGVITGGSHMSFASGVPPSLVKSKDLRAELSEDDGHAAIASVAMAFVRAQVSSDVSDVQKASSQLSDWITQSYQQYWTPILTSFEEEGLYALKPPCNCNNPKKQPYDLDRFFGGWINYYPCLTPTTNCREGSPWAAKMMVKLAGLEKFGVSVNATSAFHPVKQTRPQTNLPYVFEKCAAPTKDCHLTVTVVTENKYKSDPLDTGFYPQAATEQRAKQLSRQRMYLAAGVPNVNFNETDAMALNRCADLNKEALAWALKMASPRTRMRFEKVGQQVVFGDDVNGEGGPLWIDQTLKQKDVKGSDGVTRLSISSIAGDIKVNFPVKSVAGTHYCKLYSPAAALEWMLVDGLRLEMSL